MKLNFDLNNFNLKSLDFKNLLKRKDLLSAFGIVFLFLIIGLIVVKINGGKTERFKKRIAGEEERLLFCQTIASIQKELSRVTATYIKKEDGAKNIFQDIARQEGVRISAIKVEKRIQEDSSEIIFFKINTVSKFHNLGKFISALEAREDLLSEIKNISLKKISGEASVDLSGEITVTVRRITY